MKAVPYLVGNVVLNCRDVIDGPPAYIYGRAMDVQRVLTLMDKNLNTKDRKYPLIVLRLDTETNEGVLTEVNLNVLILGLSRREYTDQERYRNVIVPTLYPIYERFMVELKNSGYFIWKGYQNRPPHTKIDRPFWGQSTDQGNVAYPFADVLDGIEMVDIVMKLTNKGCDKIFDLTFAAQFN